jgi:hypothetical protein
MDRMDHRMHKILTALALGFALSGALAEDRATAPATPALQGGLMQANLVVSPVSPQRKADAGALKGTAAEAKAASEQPAQAEHHHTTSGMLLAALALMVGIVLRRWSGDER